MVRILLLFHTVWWSDFRSVAKLSATWVTIWVVLGIEAGCVKKSPERQNPLSQATTWGEVTFDEIHILGEDPFREATLVSLNLLKDKPSFQQIKPYLRVIRPGQKSGMRADDAEPTFEVAPSTWSHSPIWYASTIVHDGHHSQLYHSKQPWTGTEAEKKCLTLQRQALVELNAPQSYLDYIDKIRVNPTYHLQTNPE